MSKRFLLPRSEAFIRRWGEMIASEASGTGFDLRSPRQQVFLATIDEFHTEPTPENFDAIWSEGVTTEFNNPGGPILRSSFNGDLNDLVDFVDTLRSTESFDSDWEARMGGWKIPVWELFSRLSDSSPIVTSESVAGLAWFGIDAARGFDSHRRALEDFCTMYDDIAGHPTAGTSYELEPRIEVDELMRLVQSLDKQSLAPELKGPYGDFYRVLYGGSEGEKGRVDAVELIDVGPIVRAYAWGKVNGAYVDDDNTPYWQGSHWENSWKEQYAQYIDTDVRDRFDLADLDPDDIDPLFEALMDRDASSLSKPVANQIMGSQWGQYTWNDVVDHFRGHPIEASQVLSLFFDDDVDVVDRLAAFREHTIHIAEEDGRGPGTLERMATSLLMFVYPEEHIGLPSARTKSFMEAKSTLPKFRSGFRPRQYWTVIVPLRELREELSAMLNDRGYEHTVSMIDVHSIIWMYGDDEREPTPEQLPPDDW